MLQILVHVSMRKPRGSLTSPTEHQMALLIVVRSSSSDQRQNCRCCMAEEPRLHNEVPRSWQRSAGQIRQQQLQQQQHPMQLVPLLVLLSSGSSCPKLIAFV